MISSFANYGFAAFFKPIASELGFSRAVTSIASSISRFEGGFEGPIAGWISDRFGPRWIMLFGVFLAGLSLIVMYFVHSLWAYLLVWGVMLGTGHNFATGVPLDVALSNWFVKKRGVAISIKWVLSGFSALPIAAWLIINYGWRMTAVIGGVTIWLIGLPLYWFWVRRRRPEYYGLLPDGATQEISTKESEQMIERGVKYAAEVKEVEFTLRQALKTPSIWLLLTANSIHGLAAPIINIHSVPFLTDRGISPLLAASMLGMLIFVGLPLRVVGGLLADRVEKNHFRFLFSGAFFLQALGFALFLLKPTTGMIYIWFIVYGIGNGLAYGLQVPIWGRYFGRKAIGSIRGTSSLIMMPVGVIAPVWAGWVYDTTGSYTIAFIVVTGLLFLATFMMALAIPPKPPSDISDISKIV